MNEPQNKSEGVDVIVWFVVLAAFGFLAWFGVPKWIKAHQVRNASPCTNNLRQIDGAKNEWALEKGKTNGTPCTAEDIKPYIKLDAKGRIPHCPDGGFYTIGKVGDPPTCSLAQTEPWHALP